MAEPDCRPQVHACAIRLAKLDTTGAPLVGAGNVYVSDALVEFAVTNVYTEGDEIEDKTACGAVGLYYKAPDTFKRIDVRMTLITPDPFVDDFLGGDSLTVAGRPLGSAAPPLGTVDPGDGISVELWARRILDGDPDPDWPWAQWAYPKINNWRPGDRTHAGAGLRSIWTGRGFQNELWGDGPMGDFAADSDRVYQWIPTDSIPAATCALTASVADV